jgi:hypothetical protein
MDVRLVAPGDAAVELGRDPSGIRKRLRPEHPNPLLTDESRKHVVMVDGELVESLTDLILRFQSYLGANEETHRSLQAAEDQVALLKIELGEAGSRSTAEVQALAEALESAGAAQSAMARALRERLSRD